MRTLRPVLLLVLALTLFAGSLLGAIRLAAGTTVLNADYLDQAAHRQGLYALIYAGAADLISDEADDLPSGDPAAARTALAALIDGAALREVVMGAATQLRGLVNGDRGPVTLDLSGLKARIIGELERAGGSAETGARLRGALDGLPDGVALTPGAAYDGPAGMMWAAIVATTSRPILLLLAVGLALLGIFALANRRRGLLWSGATLLASGLVLATATTVIQRAVAAGRLVLPALGGSPLPAATTAQLATALAGMAGELLGHVRNYGLGTIVLGLALLVGCRVCWRGEAIRT